MLTRWTKSVYVHNRPNINTPNQSGGLWVIIVHIRVVNVFSSKDIGREHFENSRMLNHESVKS